MKYIDGKSRWARAVTMPQRPTLSNALSHTLQHAATQSNIPTAQLSSRPTHTAKARQASACVAWAVLSQLTSDALRRSVRRSPTHNPTLSDTQSDALRRSVRRSPTLCASLKSRFGCHALCGKHRAPPTQIS